MPDYTITLTSTGAGTKVLPLGTIWAPNTRPEYDKDNATPQKIRTLITFTGIFQEATEVLNAAEFLDLQEFAADAGKTAIKIEFGATLVKNYPKNARGPRITDVRPVFRPGWGATHAGFEIDFEVIDDPDADGDSVGGVTREKIKERYNERLS